jgi:hypothetical protein
MKRGTPLKEFLNFLVTAKPFLLLQRKLPHRLIKVAIRAQPVISF